jgi:riboflavin kinase/FMN adenylyltransferase
VNLPFPENRTIPRLGVYASVVRTPVGIYRGVTNVGIRPTVNDGMIRPVCETFLLDFSGDLYDCPLRVEFGRFLRPEKKFPSLEYLRLEILSNAEQTRQYFKES